MLNFKNQRSIGFTFILLLGLGTSAQQQQVAQNSTQQASQDVSVANVSSSQEASPTAVSEVILQKESRKTSGFGVSYFLIGGQTLIDNNKELSSFDVFDSYLSFNYKVDRNMRFAMRPAFGYSVEGLDNKGRDVTNKSRVRDLSFLITFTNVAEDSLPADMSYKIQPRLYLPTSDGSQEQGMIARFRFEQEINWEFQKYSNLRVYLVPSYFFQRSTASADAKGRARTTSMADSEHGIEYGYSINKTFAIKPCLHFVDKWSNASPANNQAEFHSSVIDYRLGLEVRATRDFSFTLGLQAEDNLFSRHEPMEYSYSFMTGGTLF